MQNLVPDGREREVAPREPEDRRLAQQRVAVEPPAVLQARRRGRAGGFEISLSDERIAGSFWRRRVKLFQSSVSWNRAPSPGEVGDADDDLRASGNVKAG